MKKRQILTLTIMTLFFWVQGGQAKDIMTPDELQWDRLSSLVEVASGGEAQLVDAFNGPGGLIGVRMMGRGENGKALIGWVTPGAEVLLIGEGFTRNGAEITGIAAGKYLSGPTKEQALSAAKQASVAAVENRVTPEMALAKGLKLDGYTMFKQDDPAATILVFVETTCNYCIRLHRTITGMSDEFIANKIQVKWLPVSFSSSESRHAGAQILEHGLPMVMDGTAPVEVSEESLASVDKNSALLWEISGEQISTPTVIWRSAGIANMTGRSLSRGEIQNLIPLLLLNPKE